MTTAERILARILEHPNMVPAVQRASPETFCAVLAEVGLADAGELLAMATPEQFVAAIDTTLWSWDGTAEQFDHERFAIWLEVLLEGGEELVVRRLLELPEETLVHAFVGQLYVLDVDALGIDMATASWADAELAERILDACHHLEFGKHVLLARHSPGWDAVVQALLSLDRRHHDVVTKVLDACARATAEMLEQHGLRQVLSEAERIGEDARAEKNDRRAKRGYVSAEDAAAFLRLADAGAAHALPTTRDGITLAALRSFEPVAQPAEPPSGLRALLAEAKPVASNLDPWKRHAARRTELGFLANLLLAADRARGPAEAATMAVKVVERGIRRARALGLDTEGVEADRLFRLGWVTS